ncbi:hypothetical protein GT348_07120 [Aristophania vespae]|uniref:Mu-like prophage FluMu protein gp28 n=3 Tax=Aristophania vespae TaxID=2697033 RepID=A0A6P1NHN3_9PROT|nr:hypothetical protein GT348_07120 [Aristophania vespae]
MHQVTMKVNESFWKDPEKEGAAIKVFRIDFGSGHKVLALPSRARALRGMQGLAIIDEAAFHDKLEELLKAAMALLMWGGKVLIISTHNGEQNAFNILVNDVRSGRKPYHLIRLTLDDALSEGLYRKICEQTGRKWSPEGEAEWRSELIAGYGPVADEELFCIPSSGTGSYLPLALIEARSDSDIAVIRWGCDEGFVLLSETVRTQEANDFIRTDLSALLAGLDRKTPHVFGVDFGRSGDLTVIWVMALSSNMVRQCAFIIELRNVPFEQQKQILHHTLDRLPRLRAGAMDGRGNGQYLAEVTMQKYGPLIQAVMLSESWYRQNMPALKASFEDGLITVPRDREIIDDLRALTLIRGVARIPEKRTAGATGKRHGDAAIALALAYAASRSETSEYAYEAVHLPWGKHAGNTMHHTTPHDEEENDWLGGPYGRSGLVGKVML